MEAVRPPRRYRLYGAQFDRYGKVKAKGPMSGWRLVSDLPDPDLVEGGRDRRVWIEYMDPIAGSVIDD